MRACPMAEPLCADLLAFMLKKEAEAAAIAEVAAAEAAEVAAMKATSKAAARAPALSSYMNYERPSGL